MANAAPPHVIAVMSSQPGEGKSMLIGLLAGTLSVTTGLRILVIDLDASGKLVQTRNKELQHLSNHAIRPYDLIHIPPPRFFSQSRDTMPEYDLVFIEVGNTAVDIQDVLLLSQSVVVPRLPGPERSANRFFNKLLAVRRLKQQQHLIFNIYLIYNKFNLFYATARDRLFEPLPEVHVFSNFLKNMRRYDIHFSTLNPCLTEGDSDEISLLVKEFIDTLAINT